VPFPVKNGTVYCSCAAAATDRRRIEARWKRYEGSMKAMLQANVRGERSVIAPRYSTGDRTTKEDINYMIMV
jgi:hypothetical protein